MSRSALVDLDPLSLRFSHARVRPVFSGCGARLEETLAAVLSGRTPPGALPPMAVLRLPPPAGSSASLLVSLNNRRLWVLRAARMAGASFSTVPCRLRDGSPKEAARYTLERCAAAATLMREHREREESGAGGVGDGDGEDDDGGSGGEAADAAGAGGGASAAAAAALPVAPAPPIPSAVGGSGSRRESQVAVAATFTGVAAKDGSAAAAAALFALGPSGRRRGRRRGRSSSSER